jgi:hypothetical protein
VLPDGTNGPTLWRIGRQLKQLLVMLTKSKRGKKRETHTDKSRWHFSPLKREKQLLSIQEKENQPPEERVLAQLPLLRLWFSRGQSG